MNNPLDLFAWKLRTERKRQHLTQKALAERLHMSVRTIIEIEKCKSNPKFETVALLAKELNISLDAEMCIRDSFYPPEPSSRKPDSAMVLSVLAYIFSLSYPTLFRSFCFISVSFLPFGQKNGHPIALGYPYPCLFLIVFRLFCGYTASP